MIINICDCVVDGGFSDICLIDRKSAWLSTSPTILFYQNTDDRRGTLFLLSPVFIVGDAQKYNNQHIIFSIYQAPHGDLVRAINNRKK